MHNLWCETFYSCSGGGGGRRWLLVWCCSEWFPIISGVPPGSVLCPLLFILHTREMFVLVENRLSAYASYSTLLAVVRKPADRPAVAASLNTDLARIREWCNHLCVILNPNKSKVLVVSRSRSVSPPNGDLVLSMVSIRASPNLDILGVKFDSKLTFENHVRGIVSSGSPRIAIFRLVERIYSMLMELLRTSGPLSHWPQHVW